MYASIIGITIQISINQNKQSSTQSNDEFNLYSVLLSIQLIVFLYAMLLVE
jgi:hypothetical protein